MNTRISLLSCGNKKILPFVSLFLFLIIFPSGLLYAKSWKAGVAKSQITPEDTVWMSGYAYRNHHAEGALHDLWIKALALEDSSGNQALLITSDLLGFPKNVSDRICSGLSKKLKLKRSHIILSSSHTHTSPALKDALYPAYPLNKERIQQIEKYTQWLEKEIIRTSIQAFEKMETVTLFSGQGSVRFGINRRNNDESKIELLTEFKGPVDHSVPVMAVRRSDGSLLSVVFGYACHATVLSFYQWSGDYPGFAQLALESYFPNTTALFFAGAGGDINPLPRRSVSLAEQYGEELASAVKRVLKEEDKMEELSPTIDCRYTELELMFDQIPEKAYLDTLVSTLNSNNYQYRWAKGLLNKIEAGDSIPASYKYYPVQTWKLGSQEMIILGGEVVVEYAIRLKRLLGQGIFVMAYANDVMGYIPSLRILREGGYEGFSSSRVYNLPSSWAPDIEERIIRAVYDQVQTFSDY